MFLHALRPSHLTNGMATSGRSTRVASRALTALAAANSARTAAPMSARRSSGPMRVGVFGCFILLNAAFYSIHAIAPDHAARIRRARRGLRGPGRPDSTAAQKPGRYLFAEASGAEPKDASAGRSSAVALRLRSGGLLRLRASTLARRCAPLRMPALIVCAAAHTRYLAALSAESDSEVRGAGAMRS